LDDLDQTYYAEPSADLLFEEDDAFGRMKQVVGHVTSKAEAVPFQGES
jgi:hypothetical protein